jgi:hypothetical protein
MTLYTMPSFLNSVLARLGQRGKLERYSTWGMPDQPLPPGKVFTVQIGRCLGRGEPQIGVCSPVPRNSARRSPKFLPKLLKEQA